MGVQAAYLSLSRGEGGQNLIGPELGPELGIIRTEELLAARQLDGARQFFTRAYDFGYSKTAEETFRFWPRDSLLADVLSVIRRFRPQIVVSIFSGTPRDGHGQHQVSGILARQAFEVLKDSSWGPVKLYRTARFDTAGTTLLLQGGALDPVAGQSYHQLAMAGRRTASAGAGSGSRSRRPCGTPGTPRSGSTASSWRARRGGWWSGSTPRPRPSSPGRSRPAASPSPWPRTPRAPSPTSCAAPSREPCTTGPACPPSGAGCRSSRPCSRWRRAS